MQVFRRGTNRAALETGATRSLSLSDKRGVVADADVDEEDGLRLDMKHTIRGPESSGRLIRLFKNPPSSITNSSEDTHHWPTTEEFFGSTLRCYAGSIVLTKVGNIHHWRWPLFRPQTAYSNDHILPVSPCSSFETLLPPIPLLDRAIDYMALRTCTFLSPPSQSPLSLV